MIFDEYCGYCFYVCNYFRSKEKVQTVLETMGISPMERPDKVPVEQLVKMSELFYQKQRQPAETAETSASS